MKRPITLKRLKNGGRRSIRTKQWAKFTVKYSMSRFLETGGGTLLIIIKGEPFLAIITNGKQ